MSVYNTKDNPVSETKLKELISRKGEGEVVPEGTTIFYKPDFVLKDGIKVKNTTKVEKFVKRVGGKPTPRTFDRRDTDKVGSIKSDTDDEGNIKSPRTFKVFENGKSRKGTDIEFLRKMRKESQKAKERKEKKEKEDFRKKEEEALKKKKFSLGGLAVSRPQGVGIATKGFGRAYKK